MNILCILCSCNWNSRKQDGINPIIIDNALSNRLALTIDRIVEYIMEYKAKYCIIYCYS